MQDVDNATKNSCGILQKAVRLHRTSMVAELLDVGWDVDCRGCVETPLQVAAAEGYIDVMELLLNRGADVNAINPDNQTALFAASVHCQV